MKTGESHQQQYDAAIEKIRYLVGKNTITGIQADPGVNSGLFITGGLVTMDIKETASGYERR